MPVDAPLPGALGSPVDCPVGRMDPERARPCERGCNGCDDCTDYDDEGVTVQSKIQLMAVAKAEDTSRIFELEQRCAALEEQADLDTIRMGRLAESNQKLKDLNREMFVSRCQAHMSAEAAEQDAARFRMLLQQNKHWLGVFACNQDGTPSDSLDHAELTARLDALIAQEPAPEQPKD